MGAFRSKPASLAIEFLYSKWDDALWCWTRFQAQAESESWKSKTPKKTRMTSSWQCLRQMWAWITWLLRIYNHLRPEFEARVPANARQMQSAGLVGSQQCVLLPPRAHPRSAHYVLGFQSLQQLAHEPGPCEGRSPNQWSPGPARRKEPNRRNGEERMR